MRYVLLLGFGISLLLHVGMNGSHAAEEKNSVKPQPILATNASQEHIPGAPGVRVFTTQAELDKGFPNVAWKFDRKVDFDKESLLFVEWGTSGPPFGKLEYSVSEKNGIVFSVAEPNVQVRGQAYKIGADWFTIPPGTKVGFTK